MLTRVLFTIGLVSISTGIARAGDPFVFTETATTGTPQTAVIKSHSVTGAIDDLLLGRGPGAALFGRDVSASLNYAGVPNALRINVSADHSTATVIYPGRSVQTFTTTGSAYSLDRQVYDSIIDSHNRDWEDLQARLNRESYIMPADGNPSAATAFLADQSFNRFAILHDQNPADSQPKKLQNLADFYAPTLSFNYDGSHLNTNGFDGYDLRWEIGATGRISPHIGYSVAVPYQYRRIDGADSQTIGVDVGLPVDVLGIGRRPAVAWTLTPFVGFAVNDSRNLGSSVGIFDAGLASRFVVRFGRDRDWAIAVGSQFTGYDGLHFDRNDGFYGDDDNNYDYYGNRYRAFRGHVSQQLVKNDLQVVHDFGRGLSVDAGVTYSSFVENAAVDQWWTPRIGIGWQIDRHFGLRWDVNGDLANHYTAIGGRFEFDFRF